VASTVSLEWTAPVDEFENRRLLHLKTRMPLRASPASRYDSLAMTVETMPLTLPPIAFIGGGNMALAILGGLRRSGAPAEGFIVVEPHAPQRERLQAELGITALPAADPSLAQAGLVVWAVKPQMFAEAAAPCAPFVGAALQLSIMAGIRSEAIVTASGSAALADCLKISEARLPSIPIRVVHVAVQGAGAAEEIARAIDAVNANAERLGVDVLVVTRGGGSREDLQPFNERVVADAAFRSRLPLVAAIGHESDLSVIELVADLRASTPTQAAMLLLPDL